MASISEQIKEDKLLLARVEDALKLCHLKNIPKFVGFLDERQSALVKNHLASEFSVMFFGGYPSAQRLFLGCFPQQPSDESFPIVSIHFQYREQAALTHRDFLGALISSGIRRESIGDILCQSGNTVVFVDRSVASFIIDSVDRVGGEGVRISSPYTGNWDFSPKEEMYNDTVASLRLDAVLRVMLRHSRTKAVSYIQAGLVNVNHQLCTCASQALKQGDVVSVKGSGRYLLKQVGAVTKKGRLFITVSKFI